MQSVRPTVLILGAGINGAAIARELALGGVGVTVVDRGDVSCGATAYSSRLIHGGLRYLEYGEFDLVRESLAERTRLLRLAPHFVRPLELFIPVVSRLGGFREAAPRFLGWRRKPQTPQPRGLWLVNAGLRLYDRLARSSPLPPRSVHRVGDPGAPPVDPQKYRWVCSYWDAQIVYPERFTLALLEDARRAAQERGLEFRVFTYHAAELRGPQAVIAPVTLAEESPAADQRRESFALQPAAVVNATGVWVDQTLRRLAVPAPRLMGGTKGSHILTHHAGLREALAGRGVYCEAGDGRPVFLLPFGQGTLVGTTDLPFEQPPETAVADESEIAYLLAAANAVFPQVGLRREDVSLHYSGVRPLPYVDATAPAAITRRHFLKEHPEAAVPLFSVIGGKLTTCRSLAEEVAAAVLPRLGRTPAAASRQRVIPGGEDWPQDEAAQAAELDRTADRLGFSREQVEAVWRLCGRMAEEMLAPAPDVPEADDDRANLPGIAIPLRFVRCSLRREWPRRLADVVERRLMLHFHEPLPENCLRRLAELMVEAGLLPPQRLTDEMDHCLRRLAEHYGKRVISTGP